uniref:Uncharacterized protein n=1 Tax=Anguilla anguilla TaxID=7936 RepID=A0A0E9TSD6_ANGAN
MTPFSLKYLFFDNQKSYQLYISLYTNQQITLNRLYD